MSDELGDGSIVGASLGASTRVLHFCSLAATFVPGHAVL